MQISLLDGWLVSAVLRTVDPRWGEWLNSSADFNPNHNHVNAAPKLTSPSKITVRRMYSSHYKSLKLKIKKSGIGHQIFLNIF